IARNATDSPTRLSDHDPTLLLLRLKATQSADLHVQAGVSPGSVQPGETATFTVDAGNAGPDAAAFAAVAIVFDQAVQAEVAAPAGWSCNTLGDGGGNVGTITCTIDSLAAGATQSFPVTVTPDAAMAGTTLGLAAAVQSQTPDPVSSNDGATASLEVLLPAQADLSLSIDGPATLPRTAFRAEYVFTLANNGGVDAAQPTLLIEGNT